AHVALVDVRERVLDEGDEVRRGIAGDAAAELRRAGIDALIDDFLDAEKIDRAVDLDVVTVDRHREPFDLRRLVYRADGSGTQLLRRDVRIAAADLEGRVPLIVEQRVLDRK